MTSDPVFGGIEPPQRRLRYPAIVELIILGGLVLVLMIGLLLIRRVYVPRKVSRAGTALLEAVRYLRSEPRPAHFLGQIGVFHRVEAEALARMGEEEIPETLGLRLGL